MVLLYFTSDGAVQRNSCVPCICAHIYFIHVACTTLATRHRDARGVYTLTRCTTAIYAACHACRCRAAKHAGELAAQLAKQREGIAPRVSLRQVPRAARTQKLGVRLEAHVLHLCPCKLCNNIFVNCVTTWVKLCPMWVPSTCGDVHDMCTS